ncbi:hypothetical protein M404DRAFT_22129 [Pisolithus tinctorius Marx 270]|uniref:Zn(2)-C6 fungal-type domain-containing protein n=1 Tax=Pisolithus tinctorius Marx 270 TaxID=870435 RepID=A0A0C3PMT0_PISTI|nr:hypothetical protein M404DRAFT_22129 [Pisolithus tinctorius Marx 270]
MSDSRLIVAADNNNEGQVVVDWAQVPDDDIRYDTDDEEEVMRAKAKERKRQKAAEQARQEEQARLEAERVAREKAEAERAEQERAETERAEREAEEKRVCEEEERQEAEHRRKAEAGKGSEAGAGGSEAGGEVKKVVMDPGCTRCTRANTVCEFLMDGNKKRVTCIRCNQSKGKCRWPGDGKDAEAGPKAVKGKKRKVDEENAEAGPSNQKRARTSVRPTEVLDLDEFEAGGSGMKEVSTARADSNNLASLFELHETAVENSGRIADVLESILDESYGFGMAVSPSDLGSSELDSDELREEAEWLKAHGKDEEEESEGEDESMAEAE